MKENDLPNTYLQENNILESTLAYDFPNALLTFTFSYGSQSQSSNAPLHIFWRWRVLTTLRIENPQSWDTIKIELKLNAHPTKKGL